MENFVIHLLSQFKKKSWALDQVISKYGGYLSYTTAHSYDCCANRNY